MNKSTETAELFGGDQDRENKKKIIKIVSAEPIELEMRSIKEALYLQAKGADLEIILWNRSEDREKEETRYIEGIKCTTFYVKAQMGTFLKQLGAIKRYKKACREYLKGKKIDFLHCQNLQGIMVGAYASHGKQTKLVFDMREHYEVMSPLYRKFRYVIRAEVNRLLKKCSAVLYVAESLKGGVRKEQLKKFYPLPNYPLARQFQNIEKTKSDFLRISYIGVLRSQIELFTMLFEACKDMERVRIGIHGGGIDYEQLKEISKKYKNVFMTGEYNAMEDSASLYSETDLLFCIYPPVGQNASADFRPIKFMEAMITATPVLVERQMGLAKVVEEEKIGYVVDGISVRAIQEVVEKVERDQNQLLEYWHNNIEKVKDQYCWEKAVTVLDGIYF